jgi:hypothetical protein
MAKKASHDLLKFLIPFPAEVQETALWLREFVWDFLPESNELIYDNYNALVIGFGTSDKASDGYCSIAVYARYVNFGLLRGSEISDPKKILNKKNSLYRKMAVKGKEEFPKTYMKKLLKEAYKNSLSRLKGKQSLKGKIITKSISPVKKRPRLE